MTKLVQRKEKGLQYTLIKGEKLVKEKIYTFAIRHIEMKTIDLCT